MSDLRDWKRYRGYMPMRMLKEDTVKWLGALIGRTWMENVWCRKYGGYHEVRFRFGDVQEAQIYFKDNKWRGMPIRLWLLFTERDESLLDEECWDWIRSERTRVCGTDATKVCGFKRPFGGGEPDARSILGL